jgi:protein-disulfide isomerase
MTRKNLVLIVLIAFAAIFAVGGYLYKSNMVEQPAAPQITQTITDGEKKDEQSQQAKASNGQLEREYSPTYGPDNAKVTIVEFLDPACEACRAFFPFVKKILEAKPDEIRLVVRYAAFHQGSDIVVRMLEAARLQGKFKIVLAALFEAQPKWAAHGQPNLDDAWKAAASVGLDIEKARSDMMMPEITARLNQDAADVQAFGVNKTPTFFVNGKPLPSFGSQQLVDLVAAELKQ